MKLLATLAAILVASIARADTVSVDFAAALHPISHAAAGVIHSISPTTPSDSLVTPLKLNLIREEPFSGYPFRDYSRVSVGGFYQTEISNVWKFRAPWPGDGGSWSAWETMAKSYAQQAVAQNKHPQYEIWNEPDQSFFWGRSVSQYEQMWKHAYQAIRSVDPNAVIVGPSTAQFSDNGFLDVPEFLTWAKANKVLPSVVSFHEFNSGYVISDVNDLKAFGAKNGIDVSRVSTNEYSNESEATRPGALPRYFGGIETAGVESAARSCWGDNCFNNSLDGLLANGKPLSTWWTYQRYAAMQGTVVSTKSGSVLDAVASEQAGVAYALVGKRGSSSGTMSIVLNNLDDIAGLASGGKVHVLAERIANSGTTASSGPTTALNANYTLSSGNLTLSLPNFNAYDAYAITVTPVTATLAVGGATPEPTTLVYFAIGAVLMATQRICWQKGRGRS